MPFYNADRDFPPMSQMFHGYSQSRNNGFGETYPINDQTFHTQGTEPNSYMPEEFSTRQFSDGQNAQRIKPIPIHRWKISFSGEEKKVSPSDLSAYEFVFQLNVQKQVQCIRDGEMLSHVSQLLTHSAKTWYFANYGRFLTWNDFVNALHLRFRPNYSLIDAIGELSNRRQKKTETPIAFLNHMIMAIRTLPVNFTDQQQVDLIQRNLLPEVQLAVAPWQPRSVGHLEHLLALMNVSRVPETTPIASQFTKRYTVRKSVNALQGAAEEEEDDESEIELTEEEICSIIRTRKQKQFPKKAAGSKSEEVSKERVPRKEIRCHNCREAGHVFKDCTKPREGIFCFTCGKEGVKVPDCPECTKNVDCLAQESEATMETGN